MDPNARSSISLEFEAFFRGLPRAGALPSRDAFKPQKAKRFLRELILLNAPSAEDQGLKVRLVGSAIHRRIQRDITGQNYLDFVDSSRRQLVLDVVREMLHRPTGVWQIMPVHYERGFSQNWELTAFPLSASADGVAFVLAFVRPFDAQVRPVPTGERAIAVGQTTAFEYIEIIA